MLTFRSLGRKLAFYGILFSALAGVPAAHGAESRWHTLVEAEVLGGYSEIPGRDGTFSSIDSWLFSPSLVVDDSLSWINLYNGTFNRSAQVVATEEGGRQTETTQTHSVSTALKREVRPGWFLRPLLFADAVFVNETNDEDFGEGLYDYHQLGAGLESTWAAQAEDDRRHETRLGFRYLNRRYPNYESLLSLFNRNGAQETDEKDLHGYKTNLAYASRSPEGWSYGAEAIVFYKDYTDKKTIDANGVLTGEGREDWVEHLNVFVSRPVCAGWVFSFDAEAAWNQSNLDYYDTRGTALLGDDRYLKDYFDYRSLRVKPSLTYSAPWGDKKKLIWNTSYAFYVLYYPGRTIQDPAGAYGSEDQEDHAHTVSSKLTVPLTENLSWVGFGSYTAAESNQEYEAFYLYTYDLWTAVTGFSFSF